MTDAPDGEQTWMVQRKTLVIPKILGHESVLSVFNLSQISIFNNSSSPRSSKVWDPNCSTLVSQMWDSQKENNYNAKPGTRKDVSAHRINPLLTTSGYNHNLGKLARRNLSPDLWRFTSVQKKTTVQLLLAQWWPNSCEVYRSHNKLQNDDRTPTLTLRQQCLSYYSLQLCSSQVSSGSRSLRLIVRLDTC